MIARHVLTPSVSRVQTLSRRQMIQLIVTNDGTRRAPAAEAPRCPLSGTIEVFRARRAAAIRAPTEQG